MLNLEIENIDEFKKRFYCFNDNVIRSIAVTFPPIYAHRKVEIVLSTRDSFIDDAPWVNLSLRITGVTAFAIQDAVRGCYQVLSNGIFILPAENGFLLEFGDFTDQPSSIEEAMSSKFFIFGRSVEWEIQPYKE